MSRIFVSITSLFPQFLQVTRFNFDSKNYTPQNLSKSSFFSRILFALLEIQSVISGMRKLPVHYVALVGCILTKHLLLA
jgi:hypothetical protein